MLDLACNTAAGEANTSRHQVPTITHERRRKGPLPCNCSRKCSSGRIPTFRTRSVEHATVSLECQKRSIDKFLTHGKMIEWHRRVETALPITLWKGSFFLVPCVKFRRRRTWAASSPPAKRNTRYQKKTALPVSSFQSYYARSCVLPSNFSSVEEANPCWVNLCITTLTSSELHQTRRYYLLH